MKSITQLKSEIDGLTEALQVLGQFENEVFSNNLKLLDNPYNKEWLSGFHSARDLILGRKQTKDDEYKKMRDEMMSKP